MSGGKFHSKFVEADGIHTVLAYTFADATARTAFSGVTTDVGKIAAQSDNGSYWIILSVSPTAWKELTAITTINHGDLNLNDGTNPHGTTKADVGLGSADNTSDIDKPVSTAQGLADTAVQNFSVQRANHTGTQTSSTISDFASTVRSTILTGISFITSTAVTATDTVLEALGKLQAQLTSHVPSTTNPHSVTKAQVGLGNADNTSDADKPVSTAQQTALDLKYDNTNPANYIDSAGAPVQPADIADFETTTQLNNRDTANRARANHTGTQLASTISDFAATVRSTVLTGLSLATATAITAADSILIALGKLQAQITNVDKLTTKGDILTRSATEYVRRAVGTDGQFLKANSANSDGLEWGNSIFFTEMYISKNVKSDAYAVIGDEFEGVGTNTLTLTEAIVVQLSDVGGGATHDIRLYDATNALVIAEVTGLTNSTFSITDLGTISNQDANDALYELQARIPSDAKAKVEVGSLRRVYE